MTVCRSPRCDMMLGEVHDGAGEARFEMTLHPRGVGRSEEIVIDGHRVGECEEE